MCRGLARRIQTVVAVAASGADSIVGKVNGYPSNRDMANLAFLRCWYVGDIFPTCDGIVVAT